MIHDLFDIFENIIGQIPDTIEKNGQLYKVELVPVKKEEVYSTADIKKEFNELVESLDSEIWEIAIDIFSKKYNAKLFDELISADHLTKEKFEQLKNAVTAFKACVADAANVRINQITDKYLHGTVLNTTED